MRRSFQLPLMVAAVAGLAAAQGPHGPQGGVAAATTLDMTKLKTMTGTVTAVHLGYGMQVPSITVDNTQIKVAPIWYLLDRGFEIKAGDAVSISAAPAIATSDSYLYAVEITNVNSKLRLTLRDSSGIPLWRGGRGGYGGGTGSGPRAEGGCLDGCVTATVAGTVDSVNAGVGIQMPTVTLKIADGKLLVIKLGPEWVFDEVELKAGDRITVAYAVASCTGENVAVTLTNAAGVTVLLRDSDCRPAWTGA